MGLKLMKVKYGIEYDFHKLGTGPILFSKQPHL